MRDAPSSSVSVVSEIARATFPASSWASFMYFAVQGLTFAILVLAANTSYQGFPRLGAVLARDRFFVVISDGTAIVDATESRSGTCGEQHGGDK